jgi:hypothetical protein
MGAEMNAPHPGGSQQLTRSGKGHPCPVCGRTKDADCASTDDLVLCHNNTGHKSNKYEQNGWVYRKDTSDGRCGVFSRRRLRRHSSPATKNWLAFPLNVLSAPISSPARRHFELPSTLMCGKSGDAPQRSGPSFEQCSCRRC